MRLWIAAILAVFCAIASGGATRADSLWTAAFSRAFGVRDVENHNLNGFTKWQAVLLRAQADDARDASACVPSRAVAGCEQRQPRADFLQSLHGLPALAQLSAVHTFVNRVRWVDDRRNYGASDYWATPDEFFARGGDCEDYAFAKFDALKRLGFTNDQMRILVLTDLKLRQPHAVLLVLVDGHLWVLDNNLRNVVPADSVRHYEPLYSINEGGWWLHRHAVVDVDSAGRRR